MASAGPSSRANNEPAALSAAAVDPSAGTPTGSTPPPAKMAKRRGRPPAIRPSTLGDEAASSTSAAAESPPKMLVGKKRGRPPGPNSKLKAANPPAPSAPVVAPPAANASNVIISSLAYTPPDPSNHPLRKHAELEPAPVLQFNTSDCTKVSPSAATASLIPTHSSTPRNVSSRSKTRVFGLEEAPVFYPTVEEFADPIKYIAWMASPSGGKAKDYGIAKIVPPEGWTPEFVLDQAKFRFRTRLQRLNSLSAEARATLNYHEQLQKFHSQQGSKRVSIPIIDRKPTDLYMLRRIVDSYGGFDAIVKARKWTEVTRKMGYPEKDCAQLSAQVKAAYMKIIMPFEEFIRKAREQGRTVNFSAAPSSGGGPSMTMAGSAPLQSSSAVTNGAPQLQMTIQSPVKPAKDTASTSQASGSGQRPSTPAPAASTQAGGSGSGSGKDASAPPAAAGTGAGTVSSSTQNGSSESDPVVTSNSSSQPPSNSGTPSSSRIILKVDGQARPAAAAALAMVHANGALPAGSDAKSWSEELLAAGLTPEEIAQIEAEAAGKRRSARKRTETSQPAPSTPSTGRKRKNMDDGQTTVIELLTTQGAEEQMCEICLRGDNGTSMLLCDDCNRGYHMFCLDPPLTTIPKSQWFCPPCLVGTGNDFGFDDGETHSLHSFWQRAELFRNSWWSIKKRNEEDSTMRAAMFGAAVAGDAPPKAAVAAQGKDAGGVPGSEATASTSASASASREGGAVGDVVMKDAASSKGAAATGSSSSALVKDEAKDPRGWTRLIPGTEYTISEDEVEREYWRLIHSPHETVEVEYGADIHSTTHGSALPTLETHPESAYAKDTWNLNNLPITAGSLLRYIKSDISGMTVPWIYVGMMFSTFCWHNEDHYTYSVNYQHWGDTKTWYGVPGADAEKFEEAMRKVAPDLFETSPDLLFQLVTMMSPDRLREQGVRVYAADQRSNEFVVTFPKAYHSGFNQGFNLNEAVNFALPDWIETGLESVKRYQQYRKFPVFSHDELLCTILHHHLTVNSAVWLSKPIGDMVDRELERRVKVRQKVPGIRERLDEVDRPESEYQCAHCNVFSYLSQATMPSRDHVSCLEHMAEVFGADNVIGCTVRLRFADVYLESMRQKVKERANQPATWKNRFRKLLITSPRPSLKTLRSLLADGERITGMPEVEQLRDFVDKANDWVERANVLLSRRPHRQTSDTYVRRSRTSIPDEVGPRGLPPSEPNELEKPVEYLHNLLEEVENLGFECPEIAALNGIISDMAEFKTRSAAAIQAAKAGDEYPWSRVFEIRELGDNTMIEMPERREFARYLARRSWYHSVETSKDVPLYLTHMHMLLEEAAQAGIEEDEPLLIHVKERLKKGEMWAVKAEAVQERERPGGGARITGAEIEELAYPGCGVATVEAMRQHFIALSAVFGEAALDLKRIMRGRKEMAQRFAGMSKTDDPKPVIKEAKGVLATIDKYNLAVPNAELIRAHIERSETWTKRFEKVVHEAFSPYGTTSRNRMESMMDALCVEIYHTADPWDHYPQNPPRRHCVCRTLDKPPEGHRDVRRCTSCQTLYHLPCLKIEEEWSSRDKEAAKTWRCPVCDPIKLPLLLQHRQTISLSTIKPLITEEAWQRENFIFLPYRWPPLKKALERLDGLTKAVADFLAQKPTPEIPEHAHMLWHSLRKVLACPVDVVLPDGTPVVDTICKILYRYAGLKENGEVDPKKPRPAPRPAPPPLPFRREPQTGPSSMPVIAAPPEVRTKAVAPAPPPAAPATRSPYNAPAPATAPAPAAAAAATSAAAAAAAAAAPPPRAPTAPSPYGSLAPPSTKAAPTPAKSAFAPAAAKSPHTQSVAASPQIREAAPSSSSSSSRSAQPTAPEKAPVPVPVAVPALAPSSARIPSPAPQRSEPAAAAPTPRAPAPPEASRPSAQREPTRPSREAEVAAVPAPRAVPERSAPERDPNLPPRERPSSPVRERVAPVPEVRHSAPERRERAAVVEADAAEIADVPMEVDAPPQEKVTPATDTRSSEKQSTAPPAASSEQAPAPEDAAEQDWSHLGLDPEGNDSSQPKKRGKRAKLVFDEEIGSTIPVNGVLAPCLCRLHREVEMISCDRCSNWYHLDCVVVTPYQAKTDKRWSCPFCCLKTERKYQYAEVKVKDSGCSPGVYVDVRATLRSTDEVIRKPQHWMLSNHRRIVLHLHHFVPAVAAGLLEKGEGTPEGSARDSAGPEADHSGISASPNASRSGHIMLPGEHSRTYAQEVGGGRPGPSRPELSAPGSFSSRPERSSSGRGPSSSGAARDNPEAQFAQERHRLGMQNLYARGVTDAMIAKWYIGWDGHRLVYPHYDRNGHMVELDLGPSIKLDADDPDGSKLIRARVARKEEEERMEQGLPPSLHPRSSEERDLGRSGPTSSSRHRDHDSRGPSQAGGYGGYGMPEVVHRDTEGRPRIVPSSSALPLPSASGSQRDYRYDELSRSDRSLPYSRAPYEGREYGGSWGEAPSRHGFDAYTEPPQYGGYGRGAYGMRPQDYDTLNRREPPPSLHAPYGPERVPYPYDAGRQPPYQDAFPNYGDPRYPDPQWSSYPPKRNSPPFSTLQRDQAPGRSRPGDRGESSSSAAQRRGRGQRADASSTRDPPFMVSPSGYPQPSLAPESSRRSGGGGGAAYPYNAPLAPAMPGLSPALSASAMSSLSSTEREAERRRAKELARKLRPDMTEEELEKSVQQILQ